MSLRRRFSSTSSSPLRRTVGLSFLERVDEAVEQSALRQQDQRRQQLADLVGRLVQESDRALIVRIVRLERALLLLQRAVVLALDQLQLLVEPVVRGSLALERDRRRSRPARRSPAPTTLRNAAAVSPSACISDSSK